MSTTAFTAEEQEAIERKGFVLRMACLPAAAVGLYFLGRPWPADTWDVRMAWTSFTAYFLFCWTSMLGTRTVVGKSWITRLGSFVNFDIFIHGPHHRHPRLAQNHLEEKMNEYLLNNPDKKYPVYASYLQATAAMLPFLWRNPGIGMNAGAAPPRQTRLAEITNFPADVVRGT